MDKINKIKRACIEVGIEVRRKAFAVNGTICYIKDDWIVKEDKLGNIKKIRPASYWSTK